MTYNENDPYTCQHCGHVNSHGRACELCGAARQDEPQRKLTEDEARELKERRDAGLA